MNIREFIASGIVESYVLGLASPAEHAEFVRLSQQYPELDQVRREFEAHLEEYAIQKAMKPPPEVAARILEVIEEREKVHSLILDQYGYPVVEGEIPVSPMIRDVKLINESFSDKISANPMSMYQLSPRQFEEWVAELLVKQGYQISLTPTSRDGGKDIYVAYKHSLGQFLYYVECKQFTPPRKVGVNVLRELYGTITHDDVTAGLIVTSSYFSSEAVRFQEKIKHRIGLIDCLELLRWLDLTRNKK